MKIAYPAIITKQDEDEYLVEFPDLAGCLTEGTSFDDALIMAKEALTGYLISCLNRPINIPMPSNINDAILVEPEPEVAFAAWLKQKRLAAGLTQKNIAEKIGIKYQVYQKLENPILTNPTIKTIKKIEDVLGEKILLI